MGKKIWSMCVSSRPNSTDVRAIDGWVASWAGRVARNKDAILELLVELAADFDDDLLQLFSAVLDNLRMDIENGERDANRTFDLVSRWIDTTSVGLPPKDKMALCQAYIRADLSPPEAIRITPADTGFDMTGIGSEMPDISDLLNDLLPDDVDGYPAFMMLSEAMGAMPEQAAQAFVLEMINQALPKQVELGRYFLLTQGQDLSGAAAQGFEVLAKSGQVDAVLLSDLIQLRKWMPEDAARAALDRAIKEALRREASGGAARSPWIVHRLMSSLPDGTGSQSIVASVSRGSEKAVATVLIKAGHGIKDSYAIPCRSATDQRNLLASIVNEGIEMYEVHADYLRDALGQALADHLPPAAGFLDVSEMIGLSEITAAMPATAAEIADPDDMITNLSAQKRGRLINQSIDWAGEFEIASSWFITDAALSDALDAAHTERQAEKAVWDAFEGQRDRWAMIFARAAAVLRHADDYSWRSFAAVTLGLEGGRSLKKIPIFDMLVALTLDVAESEGFEVSQETVGEDFEPDIAPEGKGELARLLAGTRLGPDSINGYLTGILIAPEFTSPTEWLPPLMNGVQLSGEGSIQRMLDILMLRYGNIRNDMMEGYIAASLQTAADVAQWLEGFDQASALRAAWPKKALSKEDRKILDLIKAGLMDAQVQNVLKTLLPAWLQGLAHSAMQG